MEGQSMQICLPCSFYSQPGSLTPKAVGAWFLSQRTSVCSWAEELCWIYQERHQTKAVSLHLETGWWGHHQHRLALPWNTARQQARGGALPVCPRWAGLILLPKPHSLLSDGLSAQSPSREQRAPQSLCWVYWADLPVPGTAAWPLRQSQTGAHFSGWFWNNRIFFISLGWCSPSLPDGPNPHWFPLPHAPMQAPFPVSAALDSGSLGGAETPHSQGRGFATVISLQIPSSHTCARGLTLSGSPSVFLHAPVYPGKSPDQLHFTGFSSWLLCNLAAVGLGLEQADGVSSHLAIIWSAVSFLVTSLFGFDIKVSVASQNKEELFLLILSSEKKIVKNSSSNVC